MLQIPLRTHGGVLVGDDDVHPGRVHVLGVPPRIAMDADGHPRLRLLRWPPGDPAGEPAGHLVLDVTTAATHADLAGVGDDPRPVAWEEASVTLLGPGLADLEVPVSLGPHGVGVLATGLHAISAATIENLAFGDASGPLQAIWTGTVRARLPEVEVIATADRSEIVRRTSTVTGDTRVDVTRAIVQACVQVVVHGSGGDTPEELDGALRDWAAAELMRRLGTGEPMHVRLTAADVVAWPVTMSRTLPALPADERGRCVQRLDTRPGVDDDEHTRVTVLADWNRTGHVTLEVQPEDAEPLVMTVTGEDARWMDLADRPFRWRARPTVDDTQLPWSPWRNADPTLALVIPMAAPASPSVDVIAAGLDWVDRWRQVDVTVDPGDGSSHPVSLTATTRRATVALPPVPTGTHGTAHAILTAHSGTTVEVADLDLDDGQAVITDPLLHVVERTVVPSGTGWADLSLAMVDLHHGRGEARVDGTVEIAPGTPLATWSAPIADVAAGTVQWRLHASFHDGRLIQTEWAPSEEPVIVAQLEDDDRVDVQVVVAGVGGAATRAVVTLESGGEVRTVEATQTGVTVVRLPTGPIAWRVVWHLADGSEVAGTSGTGEQDTIVVTGPP